MEIEGSNLTMSVVLLLCRWEHRVRISCVGDRRKIDGELTGGVSKSAKGA